MATKKEEELANKIITTLRDYGYSYEDMISVIRLARKKFELLNNKKMNRENVQNNLKYFLTDEVNNNQRVYKIVDGTQPINKAHVFYKGVVTNWGDSPEAMERMSSEMSENYCAWWVKNRNEVAKYYESKQKQ